MLKGQTELGPDVKAVAIPHLFNLETLTWRRGPLHPTAILNSGGWTTWDASRRVVWGHSGDDGGGNAFIGFSPDGNNGDGTFGRWTDHFPSKALMAARITMAKPTLARNLLFLCGAGVPCFLTLLAVWGFGIFWKFWFWTIQYAAHYGTEVSLSEAAAIFAAHIRGTLGTAWPIWAAGFVGLIACLVSSAIRNHALILLLFAGFSAASVCPGFYFRPHYFIAFLPALALLTAAGVIAGVEFCKVRAPNFRWARGQ